MDNCLQFNKLGYCVVPNVISGESLESCKTAGYAHHQKIQSALLQRRLDGEVLSADYSEVVERPGGRKDIRFLDPVSPLTDVDTLSCCIPLIKSILGDDGFKLCFSGLIVASPNSDAQGWHQDGPSLFAGTSLPPHCINVLVPLCGVTALNGATEIRAGSQHSDAEGSLNHPIVQPELEEGSALLFDYRVWHRGGSNSTSDFRVVAYWTFSKSWFVDPFNHRSLRRLLSVTEGVEGVNVTERQLTELSGCPKTLLEMDIELDDAPPAVFRLLEGDNPTTVATAMCEEHGLPCDEVVPVLVQQALESLGTSVYLDPQGNLAYV
eukprot:TRINITY_DN3682_c8_g1_i1.p1 TRINITY_DN3682_c8_g1~~TRINITY_DN3682_c8_g1_i1.p1  ORF type:complete len:322 (+),score=44.43 TRINITY_DN3682_c8_g1_i1:145-1110(+)